MTMEMEEVVVEIVAGDEEVPAEVLAAARPTFEADDALIIDLIEEYAAKSEEEIKTLAADPMLRSGYQYWNVLTAGPYQRVRGFPYYRPQKVITAGEWACLRAYVWINPRPSDGGGVPGTVVLGGRHYDAYFETINLTSVTNGPDRHWSGAFDNPARTLYRFNWWFRMRDPGRKPALYEATFTIDIREEGQPMAAFGTWHWDPDPEPAFLYVPAVPPRWQHDQPPRFLVYHMTD